MKDMDGKPMLSVIVPFRRAVSRAITRSRPTQVCLKCNGVSEILS